MHVNAIYFLQQIPGHFIFKTRLPKGHEMFAVIAVPSSAAKLNATVEDEDVLLKNTKVVR